MAICEFCTYKRHLHQGQIDLVEICILTKRPCFVQQPNTDAGRQLQLHCTRRTWALCYPPAGGARLPDLSQITNPPSATGSPDPDRPDGSSPDRARGAHPDPGIPG